MLYIYRFTVETVKKKDIRMDRNRFIGILVAVILIGVFVVCICMQK